ncbi:MAG: TIGR02302 family protein [Hyphomicrobium sp.]|uniref:TIGR02302 family protein n=1 Tax=Hyphomicrobium sp. TaxID=82 RepID=UPI0013295E2B|nr:TIGR02302 family protein [Hyphomicrobium sp.]KAB2939407.1 MAG: TIGR02302 family protein [Hyphomicrobium sp.]MBZ0209587.1 TIGR02302 family protein [Hyphomicrobium sp.]
MSEPKAASPVDAKFARKVRASRWALLFERLWPRMWLILGLAGLFLLASLAGLWPLLPDPAHYVVLAAFAVAGIAALLYAVRVPFPTHEEAVRRIERVSGVPHRPASSYEDTVTANADDPRTAAIWQAHRARLASALARLRVGPPHPRADRQDPIALRALLVLGVVALLALVGDSASDRLRSAFRFNSMIALAEARLDAWVTPPSYTGKPPLMLADGARGPASTTSQPKLVEVPERSVLIVRTSGKGLGAPSLEVFAEGSTERKLIEAKQPEAGKSSAPSSDIAEIRYEMRSSAEIRVLSGGSELARWAFYVKPDKPPVVAITKQPERTRRGSMKLTYSAEDDYGVVSANADVKRDRSAEKPVDPKKAWAQPQVLKGPRPPYERPPEIALRLPRPSQKEAQTYIDFGPHPYAGREVILTLEAKDLAGNVGRSKPMKLVLPQRQFEKPLARAVVEQRAKLLDDPRYVPLVKRALEALTLEPEGFIDSTSIYLGMRAAIRGLERDTSRQGLKSITDGMWELALRIEDGDLSDAEKALKEAQDKLADALEKGAPDSEIDQLMQELREALSKYVEQLTKNAQDQAPPEGLDQQNQQLSQQDLDQMMKNLEDMTKAGSRDQAQQMLSQLRDLLERLQSGQISKEQAERGRQMQKKLDELGGLVGQQQRLMDDTYRENRRQQQQPGGTMPGENGQRQSQSQQGQGMPGQEGQQGQQGQRGQQGKGLSQQQQALKEELEKLRRELEELGAGQDELNRARDAMENAQRALEEGDTNTALGDQSEALDQMRQGAQKMAEGMAKDGASRYGQNGDQPRDPLGRPQRFQGPDAGNSVKVPDEIDMQRAREILEELRRRLAQPARPMQELDYYERLLRRF